MVVLAFAMAGCSGPSISRILYDGPLISPIKQDDHKYHVPGNQGDFFDAAENPRPQRPLPTAIAYK
jgi:hypothetical protein